LIQNKFYLSFILFRGAGLSFIGISEHTTPDEEFKKMGVQTVCHLRDLLDHFV